MSSTSFQELKEQAQSKSSDLRIHEFREDVKKSLHTNTLCRVQKELEEIRKISGGAY